MYFKCVVIHLNFRKLVFVSVGHTSGTTCLNFFNFCYGDKTRNGKHALVTTGSKWEGLLLETEKETTSRATE